MNTKYVLKARFAIVRRDLDRVFAQLTDEMLPWAPTEGMRTVQGQLFEIVCKEIELLSYAKGWGREGWVEVEEFGGREKSIEGYKEVFAETRRETLAYLDSLSESGLEAPVQFPTDWWEGCGLPEMPLHEVFRTIAMHEWYHTGQLVSYLWSRSDDPYKW